MNEFILKNLLNDYTGDIYCLGEVSSTNDFAGEQARLRKECIVIAERQSAGRGRRGRQFVSEGGGLYISLSIKAPGTPFDVMHYPVLAALAVSNAIESVCAVHTDIKWPNDIQIHGKKVCGILTELVTVDDDCYLVTGIGINVRNKIPSYLPDAGNLVSLTGTEPEEEVLAAAVSNQLISVYAKGISNKDELIDQVQKRCITIGRKVTATSTKVTGIARALDDKGSLVLELPGGATKTVIFGDVTIQE